MIDHSPSRSPFASDSRPPLPFAGSERVDRVISDLLADPTQLGRWRDRCDRLLAAEGAGHLVHDLPVRADGRTAALEITHPTHASNAQVPPRAISRFGVSQRCQPLALVFVNAAQLTVAS